MKLFAYAVSRRNDKITVPRRGFGLGSDSACVESGKKFWIEQPHMNHDSLIHAYLSNEIRRRLLPPSTGFKLYEVSVQRSSNFSHAGRTMKRSTGCTRVRFRRSTPLEKPLSEMAWPMRRVFQPAPDQIRRYLQHQHKLETKSCTKEIPTPNTNTSPVSNSH